MFSACKTSRNQLCSVTSWDQSRLTWSHYQYDRIDRSRATNLIGFKPTLERPQSSIRNSDLHLNTVSVACFVSLSLQHNDREYAALSLNIRYSTTWLSDNLGSILRKGEALWGTQTFNLFRGNFAVEEMNSNEHSWVAQSWYTVIPIQCKEMLYDYLY